jgi:diadenosine tetraphosphate (Ap4A) HIT family hydrolase
MHRIPRQEAIDRLMSQGTPSCRLCALVEKKENLLASEAHASVFVSRYPVRWGHLLVVPNEHVEHFGDLAPNVWADTCSLAQRAAIAVERVFRPSRCYVASLGTADRNVPMSFPHLHFNVIPVEEASARPREVLTWEHGVFEASEAEWTELFGRLREAWDDRVSKPSRVSLV